MSDELSAAIDVLMDKIQARARELADLKKMVNMLAKEASRSAIFPDAELTVVEGDQGSIRPDQYYGKSPIQAAREYLEMRGRAVRPEEITQGLAQGGFDFEAQGWKGEAGRVRNLAISLSKNSTIFHRLPNGTYGLVKFYPDVAAEKKQPRRSGSASASPSASPSPAEDEEQEEEEGKKP
jgi:hypothetical protein